MTLQDVYVPRVRHVDPFDTLTRRERAVLHHMQDGLSAREIAATDFVSQTTVRSQIRCILYKLRVSSQLQAVAMANKREMRRRCDTCEYRQLVVGSSS